jgi:SAM-dependent methyltransferase
MSFFWDALYLFKKTPWDTGITPPEITTLIEGGAIRIGQALDLGCGTGANALYLARHGFTVTAIDVSRRAIGLAKRKARSAQLTKQVQFQRGNVTHMRRWVNLNSVDFACDIGCFHNLGGALRRQYSEALANVLKPGAIYMLYAFEPWADRAGVTAPGVAALFDRAFRLDNVQRGFDRNGRGSAWYTLMKRDM